MKDNFLYDFLYELVEDYKESVSEEDKDNIFNIFCSSVWNSNNKRYIYNKKIKFYIKDNLIDTEIGKLFSNWSNVEYKTCKFVTKDDDWCSLIRQKVNNLYNIYCDKEIIHNKEYIDSLKIPKRLYYKWIEGYEFGVDELNNSLDISKNNSLELYNMYQKQKMNLTWEEYKNVINDFFRKIFNNCQSIDEYEKTHTTQISIYQDFMTEDNFYIKYFCKSLESYMRNYQKEYYGLHRGRNKKYKRCKECGKLIEKTNNRILYCDECKYTKQLEWSNNYNHKIRV